MSINKLTEVKLNSLYRRSERKDVVLCKICMEPDEMPCNMGPEQWHHNRGHDHEIMPVLYGPRRQREEIEEEYQNLLDDIDDALARFHWNFNEKKRCMGEALFQEISVVKEEAVFNLHRIQNSRELSSEWFKRQCSRPRRFTKKRSSHTRKSSRRSSSPLATKTHAMQLRSKKQKVSP